MLIIRPVRQSDLNGLLELAHLTGFGLTTLPRDRELLAERIDDSEQSFRRMAQRPRGECYLFVMEDTARGRNVVGTCGVTSKVGGFEPFYAYRIQTDTIGSEMLNVSKQIQTLTLVQEHSGPCEIGSLFLHPDYRRDGNGRLLSLSRFLFMAEHRHRFEPQVIAEMRGVIDDQGRSAFWDAVGKHFFEIDFPKADYLSMVNKKFIADLMPRHPLYVPLVRRAHDLWRELEARTSARLMQTVGGLMIGPEDGMLVQGTLRSAREHGLPYEILSASETARRYPAFEPADGLVAVFDPRAGYLDPEACNAAHLKVASHHGAELRFEEPVITWNADGDGVIVTTKYGSYSSDHLVLSVGARTDSLLPGLPLEVERQPVFWFEPGPAHDFDGDRFPIWAYEYIAGNICYGFPRLPRGVKAAVMHAGEMFADADSVTRSIHPEEAGPLRSALADVLPVLASAPIVDQDTCLFTNTPDHDFIIDFHPEHPQVLVSSPCSGHGFKFASAIGELQADLVTGSGSSLDLTPFSLRRFG